MICFAAIGIPYFASSLNTSRLYQITLIFLAPFCVIGGITVFRMLSIIVKASWTDQCVRSSLKVLSVFFVIFLLFNSGFVYEVAKDNPSSISLNSTIDYPRFNEQEVLGAKWLYNVKGDDIIYTDAYRWLLLRSFELEAGRVRAFPADVDKIRDVERIRGGLYIYMGTLNVVEDKVLILHKSDVSSTREYINPEDIVNGRNKIYANGGAHVYYR